MKNHFSMVGGSAYKGHEAISLPTAPKRLAKIDDGEFRVEELTAAMVKIKSEKLQAMIISRLKLYVLFQLIKTCIMLSWI